MMIASFTAVNETQAVATGMHDEDRRVYESSLDRIGKRAASTLVSRILERGLWLVVFFLVVAIDAGREL